MLTVIITHRENLSKKEYRPVCDSSENFVKRFIKFLLFLRLRLPERPFHGKRLAFTRAPRYNESMLLALYPKLNTRAVRKIRDFFASGWYIAAVVLLMTAASLFSLEIAVYYVYMAAVGFAALFCDDMLPIVPIGMCSYMTVSSANHPTINPDTSYFYTTSFTVQFVVIAALTAVFLLVRLVWDLASRKKRGEKKRGAPKLTVGFLLLGAAFVLAGAFSRYTDAAGETATYYGLKTAFFGFCEFAAFSLLYFYLYFTVDWEKTSREYPLKVLLALGFGLLAETIAMYFLPDVVTEDGINRSNMYTGWGIYNNVGCMAGMCLPAPFYFAATRKNGWRYTLIGALFLAGVFLTQSRNAILFSCLLFIACYIVLLVKTKKRERLINIIILAAGAALLLIICLLFRDEIRSLFSSLFSILFDDNGRLEIYASGWQQFLENPVFGVGFYESEAELWGNLSEDVSFLPSRYHNTVIQLLASGGIVALLSYAVHRIQTTFLFFKKPSMAKTFLGLSVLLLLLTSLLDCHLFNFGPALLYSVLLVFAEKAPDGNKKGKTVPAKMREPEDFVRRTDVSPEDPSQGEKI